MPSFDAEKFAALLFDAYQFSRFKSRSELARHAGLTRAAVSSLMAARPQTATGKPSKPNPETVTALAQALDRDPDTFLLAAGYAPSTATEGPPQTVADLLKAIERLGVEGIMFHDEEKLHELDAEQLQGILNSIRTVVEMDLARLMRKH